MHRPLSRIQIPQSVKHHHILAAVIRQGVPRLIFGCRHAWICCPSFEDHASGCGQFVCQHGVLSLGNNLRFRCPGAAVGVIHDIPAVPGDFPLRPEGHISREGDHRAGGILCSDSVLFGIPAGKDPAALLRDSIRNPHIPGHRGYDGYRIRNPGGRVRKRIHERQRYGVRFLPDRVQCRVLVKGILLIRQIRGQPGSRVFAPSAEDIFASERGISIRELDAAAVRQREFVHKQTRTFKPVRVEGDHDRSLNGAKFPQGVKDHLILQGFIRNRISRLIFDCRRIRIGCPAPENHISAQGNFIRHRAVLPAQIYLRCRRLGPAVGIIKDRPFVHIKSPLRPKREITVRGNSGARTVSVPASVLLGIPLLKSIG